MTPSKQPTARIVTVSAVYGAGGSLVAPRVAERLGMPFYDRLIHTPQARELNTIAEARTKDEDGQAPPSKLAARVARVTSALGLPSPSPDDMDPVGQLRQEVRTSVLDIAAGDGGVILGRAAAIVAAADPRAFHVRLFGPAERCLLQGMEIEGITIDEARQHQADTDRAWIHFVSRLFDRDPADPRLYHLVIDSTVLPIDRSVEMISSAALAFWDRVAEVAKDAP